MCVSPNAIPRARIFITLQAVMPLNGSHARSELEAPVCRLQLQRFAAAKRGA